ncbi:MAG: hypothetical protein WCX92_09010, partial [Thermovirgaceae bacterium]
MRREAIMSIILLSSLLFTASNCSADAIPEHNSAVTLSGYSFSLDEGGIPGLGDERSVIVVISDLHLGMDDRYAETQKNRAPL